MIAARLGPDLLVVDLSRDGVEVDRGDGEEPRPRCSTPPSGAGAAVLRRGRRRVRPAHRGLRRHDRYANLETAYLLGRLERIDGLAGLATNLRQNIDAAFLRRLDVLVELAEPDRAAREQLWRRHLPPGAPCADDVDPAALAARWEPAAVADWPPRSPAAAFALAAAGQLSQMATNGHVLQAAGTGLPEGRQAFPGARFAASR